MWLKQLLFSYTFLICHVQTNNFPSPLPMIICQYTPFVTPTTLATTFIFMYLFVCFLVYSLFPPQGQQSHLFLFTSATSFAKPDFLRVE